MSGETERLRADIQRTLDRLRALRDEARLKIHLGSMEARDAWQRLEPSVLEAERVAEHASQAALDAIEATVKELSDLIYAL